MDTPDWSWRDRGPQLPHWRLQRALAEAEYRRMRLPSDADDVSRLLAKCLVELRHTPDGRRKERRASIHCRDFTEVLQWHADRRVGARIDALILARMSVAYTARQLQLDPAIVERYCVVCFDVGRRLDDPEYILPYAVASERRQGDPATSRRRTARKLFAYLCGPQVLEEFYDGAGPHRTS